MEWALFAYVRAGLRRQDVAMRELLSARKPGARAFLADAAIGALLLLVLLGAEAGLDALLNGGAPPLVQRLLVHDRILVPLWLVLSLSAAIVEEVTFRGYLQRQAGAWLRSPWLGVIVQAMLFGVTHGYQGAVPVARIAVLGLVFGVAAHLRRSLVPGIVAHAALDIIGGLQALR